MAPLRVVHAVRSDAFAGVERYIVDTTIELHRRGVQVTVVGGNPERMRTELGSAIPWFAARTTLDAARALRRAGRADVVHVHMTAAETAALTAPRHTRVVATRHFAGARGRGIKSHLARAVIERRLDLEIAISETVATACGGHPTVVVNGTPAAPLISGVHKVVLVAQRLEPEKHTGDALEIWRRAELHQDGWRLVIAGGGSMASRLRHQAESVPNVEFVGQAPNARDLHQQAALALATTPREGLGLSVVEMMAAGLPVIACGSGGHVETVGRVEPTLLYEPGDLDAAAATLRRLARDPAARGALSHRLQAHHRQHLTIERHVDRLLELYVNISNSEVRAT